MNKIRFPILKVYGDGSKGSACQVVEYGAARWILYKLGYTQRREGDQLLVFPAPPEGEYTGFYARPDKHPEATKIGSLYVDEGVYDDCLILKTQLSPYGMGMPYDEELVPGAYGPPWYELVSHTGMLRFLQRQLAPEFKAEPSPYMGAGRTRNHHAEQMAEALLPLKHEKIEFYNVTERY